MTIRNYLIAETLPALEMLLRGCEGTSRAPRIEMLIALRSSAVADLASASDTLDIPVRTLRRWWGLYRDGGITGLLGEKYRTEIKRPRATPKSSASDCILPGKVIALLNALPDRADATEWIEQFRAALVELFGDIDRITINVGSTESSGGSGPGSSDIMAVHHVGKENRRGRSAIITSEMPKEPSGQILTTMVANGFPADRYHPPHLYDYRRADGTYLGSIILWRSVTSTPISPGTLGTFASLEPFLLFMLSDSMARQQAARPELNSFTERMTEIAREYGLSKREHEVIIHYLVGRSYKVIADHLSVSLSAVRKHIEAIHEKTGAKTTAELVARFFTPIRE
jgi:DNA-binding CsgD family transcriptional regulator